MSCGKLLDLERAKQGNFPWSAAIVGKYDAENEPLCWGTLINSNYILSAAHCTSQFESYDVEVILNSQNGRQSPRRAVAKIKNHSGFVVGNFSYDNDISLLRLRHPVNLEDGGVFPICLPPEPPAFYEDAFSKANFSRWCEDCDFVQNPEERSMVMSKFIGYRSGYPYLMRAHKFGKVNIFTLKNDTCVSLYPNRIKAQFLCGEVKNSADMKRNAELKSYCQDDPGSALIHLRKMRAGCDSDYANPKEKMKVRFVQIGISFDQKNCMLHYDKPVLLFTRIRRYVSWIKENTYDGIYCDNSPV
ncbi:Serine protease 55 [Orchesella cincta]|uniref:Serine protease 55 n=1 Tax=Orchesella cincta TaxID=48709 RepID=A0A1D2N2Z3_ORCCI|nr:Serine protease 55 [Orchesella cincta]